MGLRVWVIFIVSVAVGASAQDSTTANLRENKCQEDLQACTDKYGSVNKYSKDLPEYKDCASKVDCLQHEAGYNERLTLLSSIDDVLESQQANDGNWWDNGASRFDTSLTALMVVLGTVFNVLFATIYKCM